MVTRTSSTYCTDTGYTKLDFTPVAEQFKKLFKENTKETILHMVDMPGYFLKFLIHWEHDHTDRPLSEIRKEYVDTLLKDIETTDKDDQSLRISLLSVMDEDGISYEQVKRLVKDDINSYYFDLDDIFHHRQKAKGLPEIKYLYRNKPQLTPENVEKACKAITEEFGPDSIKAKAFNNFLRNINFDTLGASNAIATFSNLKGEDLDKLAQLTATHIEGFNPEIVSVDLSLPTEELEKLYKKYWETPTEPIHYQGISHRVVILKNLDKAYSTTEFRRSQLLWDMVHDVKDGLDNKVNRPSQWSLPNGDYVFNFNDRNLFIVQLPKHPTQWSQEIRAQGTKSEFESNMLGIIDATISRTRAAYPYIFVAEP